MSALSHHTSDDTPGVPFVTQLGGLDKTADEKEEEPTVLQSTRNKSGVNQDEIKDCEDCELLATKVDNKNDRGDGVESELKDSRVRRSYVNSNLARYRAN